MNSSSDTNGLPSPLTVAQEFLVELGKCGILVVKELVDALTQSSTRTISPDDWAATVHQEINIHGGNISHLRNLGSHYLYHLIIPFRNPGGKKTPQDTIHSTPDLARIEEVELLLTRATIQRSQSALRDLVFLQDGVDCLITKAPFAGPRAVIPRCAHPCNALNIETNAHDSMDKHLAWGIEAKLCDNQFSRSVREDKLPYFGTPSDGDEITFGTGDHRGRIASPDPRICSLHLAIARASHMSGASEVFDRFLDDDDDQHLGRTR